MSFLLLALTWLRECDRAAHESAFHPPSTPVDLDSHPMAEGGLRNKPWEGDGRARRDSILGAWQGALLVGEEHLGVLRLSLCLLLWVVVGLALLDACSHGLREGGCSLVCGFSCLN